MPLQKYRDNPFTGFKITLLANGQTGMRKERTLRYASASAEITTKQYFVCTGKQTVDEKAPKTV